MLSSLGHTLMIGQVSVVKKKTTTKKPLSASAVKLLFTHGNVFLSLTFQVVFRCLGEAKKTSIIVSARLVQRKPIRTPFEIHLYLYKLKCVK